MRTRTTAHVIGALACAAVLASCGSSAAQHQEAGASQVADVAYAGSLQYINEQVVGPGFTKATGYGYEGRGGGAFGVAHEIAAGEISPNVFEAIGPGPIEELEPRFTSWYVTIAASPIVLAYNPATPFASTFAAIASGREPFTDLFSVLERPGFLLGRTDPNTDPQGQAFYEMVELATVRYHLPASTPSTVLGPLDNPAQVFPETALEARLESGQLDAASAFRSEAVQLHLPYVPLPTAIDFGDPAEAQAYAAASLRLASGQVVHGHPLTVTITEIGHHDARAALSFITYLLSPRGRRELAQGGYTLLRPTIVGSGVPRAVRAAVAGA